MKERPRADRVRTKPLFAIVSFVLVFGCSSFASGQEAKRSDNPVKLLPNSPEEPLRAVASLADAAAKMRYLPYELSLPGRAAGCRGAGDASNG
jgi:hypothetical protein